MLSMTPMKLQFLCPSAYVLVFRPEEESPSNLVHLLKQIKHIKHPRPVFPNHSVFVGCFTFDSHAFV